MAEISFYHLTRSSPETALFKLLDKAYSSGKRAIVRLADDGEVKHFDTALWTVKPDSFLPHGNSEEGDAKDEPILLTASKENLNKAEFAFIMPGASIEGLDYFERVFLLFAGDNEDQVKASREHWKTFTGEGLEPQYWTQTDEGKWHKKDG